MSQDAATHFALEKLKTDIDRRLPWLPQIVFLVIGGVGFWRAPTVDRLHSPDRLTNGFIGVITVVGCCVALLLFQRNSENTRALRFIGRPTVLYFILGIGCPLVGLLPLRESIYRYLFAGSVAALAALVTTLCLVGATSLAAQQKRATAEKLDAARELQDKAAEKAKANATKPPARKGGGSSRRRPKAP